MKQKKYIPFIIAAVCLAVLASAGLSVYFLAKRAETSGTSNNVFPKFPVSKDPSVDVLENCPFELSDSAEWKIYPSKNLIGFVALAKDYDETDQTFVLVFSHSPEQKKADNVIINGQLSCSCFYDFYQFDNLEIVEQGGLYYMKMKCDKRITVVSFGFNLEDGDIREYVGVEIFGYDSIPKMKIYYSRFDYSYPRKTENIKKTQLFNEQTESWEDVEDIVETTEDDSSEYYSWTELQVYDEAGDHYETRDGVTIGVSSYGYTYAKYDVYHEMKEPQVTTICFLVSTDDDAGVEGIKAFDINNINTKDIRLYVKDGDEYVDITPGDFYLEVESWNEKKVAEPDVWVQSCRFINLNSNELGELEERDYRLVIEGYTIDFTLLVQFFEVW